VQEVFLHALRKIQQLREPACFGAWLQRITVRVSINRATRRPPLPTATTEVLERGDDREATPLEGLMKTEQRDIVRTAVARLRPLDRDVLVAFYLKGKSLAEIADEFGVPIGTVKRRLHVARNRLQTSLEQPAATPAFESQRDVALLPSPQRRLQPELGSRTRRKRPRIKQRKRELVLA
jgi:RNA polymerase sigma-70 factor (ECF subfamily)